MKRKPSSRRKAHSVQWFLSMTLLLVPVISFLFYLVLTVQPAVAETFGSSLIEEAGEQGINPPETPTDNIDPSKTYFKFYRQDIPLVQNAMPGAEVPVLGQFLMGLGQRMLDTVIWFLRLFTDIIATPLSMFIAWVLNQSIWNPNIAAGEPAPIAGALQNVADMIRNVAVDLLLLLFIANIWKVWTNRAIGEGGNIMGPVGRLVATAALIMAWSTISNYWISISNDMIHTLVFTGDDSKIMVTAVSRFVLSGMTSLTVIAMGGPFGAVVFFCLLLVLIAQTTVLLVMKAIQAGLLIAQYVFAPIFLVCFAFSETEKIAATFVRSCIEVSLWSYFWLGFLRILLIVVGGSWNPFGQIIFTIGILQLMDSVPQFMAKAQVSLGGEVLESVIGFGAAKKFASSFNETIPKLIGGAVFGGGPVGLAAGAVSGAIPGGGGSGFNAWPGAGGSGGRGGSGGGSGGGGGGSGGSGSGGSSSGGRGGGSGTGGGSGGSGGSGSGSSGGGFNNAGSNGGGHFPGPSGGPSGGPGRPKTTASLDNAGPMAMGKNPNIPPANKKDGIIPASTLAMSAKNNWETTKGVKEAGAEFDSSMSFIKPIRGSGGDAGAEDIFGRGNNIGVKLGQSMGSDGASVGGTPNHKGGFAAEINLSHPRANLGTMKPIQASATGLDSTGRSTNPGRSLRDAIGGDGASAGESLKYKDGFVAQADLSHPAAMEAATAVGGKVSPEIYTNAGKIPERFRNVDPGVWGGRLKFGTASAEAKMKPVVLAVAAGGEESLAGWNPPVVDHSEPVVSAGPSIGVRRSSAGVGGGTNRPSGFGGKGYGGFEGGTVSVGPSGPVKKGGEDQTQIAEAEVSPFNNRVAPLLRPNDIAAAANFATEPGRLNTKVELVSSGGNGGKESIVNAGRISFPAKESAPLQGQTTVSGAQNIAGQDVTQVVAVDVTSAMGAANVPVPNVLRISDIPSFYTTGGTHHVRYEINPVNNGGNQVISQRVSMSLPQSAASSGQEYVTVSGNGNSSISTSYQTIVDAYAPDQYFQPPSAGNLPLPSWMSNQAPPQSDVIVQVNPGSFQGGSGAHVVRETVVLPSQSASSTPNVYFTGGFGGNGNGAGSQPVHVLLDVIQPETPLSDAEIKQAVHNSMPKSGVGASTPTNIVVQGPPPKQ